MFDSIRKIIFGEGINTNNRSGSNNSLFGFRNRQYRGLIYTLVSFEQARNMIEEKKVRLIDVRTKSEYDAMHIKGAENIPVDEILNKMLPTDTSENIMVYCSSGTRSKSAIQILNSMGYNNIYIWEYAAFTTFPYKNMVVYNEN